jgi:hypothetical protein
VAPQLVPYRVTVRFTLLQLVYLLGVWALTTWAGIAGVAFPLPIMALVPLRQFVLPRLFDPAHLTQLDAAEYEEAPAVRDRRAAAQVGGVGPMCCLQARLVVMLESHTMSLQPQKGMGSLWDDS